MTPLLEDLRKFRLQVRKIEKLYSSFMQEQDPFSFAIPLAYRHLAAHHKRYGIEERTVSAVGGFLAGRYPHLREALLSDRQKQDIRRMKEDLTDAMERAG